MGVKSTCTQDAGPSATTNAERSKRPATKLSVISASLESEDVPTRQREPKLTISGTWTDGTCCRCTGAGEADSTYPS